MCPLYVAGLIGPGDRKSMQPMAERLGLPSHDALHHFISAGVWDAAARDSAVCPRLTAWWVVRMPGSWWTTRPCPRRASTRPGSRRSTRRSGQDRELPNVGVPDPCGRRGAGSRRAAPVLAGGLDAILSGSTRLACRTRGVRPGPSRRWRWPRSTARWPPAYGSGPCWPCGVWAQRAVPAGLERARPGLGGRHPAPAESLSRRCRVDLSRGWPWSAPPAAHPRHPVGRCRDGAAAAEWRQVSWRRGTKGRLSAGFAARRIRVADGHHSEPRREWPAYAGRGGLGGGRAPLSGERKYYLSNLPATVSLRTLAAAIKARWVCEQAHQQMKEGRRHCLRRPRPFRRSILGGPAPTRADDHDRLRVPAAPAPRYCSKTGEKGAPVHHQSRACPPCATPSWRACYS